MGNQANILSFDEVKRGAGGARSSVGAPERSARRRSSGSARGSASPRSGGRTAPGSRYAAPARPFSDAARISGTAPSPSLRASSFRSRSSATDSLGSAARPAIVAYPARGARSASETEPRRRGAHAKPEPSRDFDADQAEETSEHRSRLREFRRKRQRNRADKKFDRQFGGSSRTSDAASAGSRAAVYKGEMGASHKRAARMQNDAVGATKAAGLARFNPLALLSGWRRSPKFIAGAGALACLVLTCWFLYTPAQQLYHSVREHDRLQAEYAAIEQRNALLESEVGALQTDAGIEDRAHAQFGWVPEGFQTANVQGLSEEARRGSGSTFTANIVPGSVQAPETWYSPMLDVLFGVK